MQWSIISGVNPCWPWTHHVVENLRKKRLKGFYDVQRSSLALHIFCQHAYSLSSVVSWTGNLSWGQHRFMMACANYPPHTPGDREWAETVEAGKETRKCAFFSSEDERTAERLQRLLSVVLEKLWGCVTFHKLWTDMLGSGAGLLLLGGAGVSCCLDAANVQRQLYCFSSSHPSFWRSCLSADAKQDFEETESTASTWRPLSLMYSTLTKNDCE